MKNLILILSLFSLTMFGQSVQPTGGSGGGATGPTGATGATGATGNTTSSIGPVFYAITNTELVSSVPTVSTAYGYEPQIVLSLALPGLVHAGSLLTVTATGENTNDYSYNLQMAEGVLISGQNKGGVVQAYNGSDGSYLLYPTVVNIIPANHHFQWSLSRQFVIPYDMNNGYVNVYEYAASTLASLGDTMTVNGIPANGGTYSHLDYILDTTRTHVLTPPVISNTMNFEVSQWLTKIGSTQPKTYYINALNTFISGLKTDGNWQYIDRMWIFADTTSQAALTSIDLSNSVAVTFNSPTFTANQGYTFNGTSTYIATRFQDSVMSNFLYNSGTLIFYDRTSSTSTFLNGGAASSGNASEFYINDYFSGNAYYSINNNSSNVTASNSNSQGLYQASRTKTNLTALYKNGTSIGSQSTAAVATQNIGFTLGGLNTNGTVATFATNQCSILVIGGGKINASTFNTRFQTFKTAIGF